MSNQKPAAEKPAEQKKTMTIKRQSQNAEAPEQGFSSFKYEGRNFKMKIPGINIPGIGVLTAADVAVSEEAQKRLVEIKSSAIEEIID